MGTKPLELPLESNPGRFGQDGDARLVNVFAEKRGTKDRAGKAAFAHYAVPGLTDWATVSNGGGTRGLFVVDNAHMIAVSGHAVVSLDPFANVTFLGGMLGSGHVSFARNLKTPSPQIVLVGDSQSKVIEAGVLSDILDPDLQPANSCDFLNRYVLFFHANGRFSYSDINAADSIAALSYYTAEGKPDGLKLGKVFGNQVWLFGEETVEIWVLTDSVDDPFRKLDGTYIDIGCSAPHSVVQVGQRLAWVAHDFTVRLASGYNADVFSNHAVSTAIEALDDPASIEASVATIRGHQMLRLNSPEWTWVCNLTVGYGLWHEEKSVGMNRRRAAHYARFAGKHITGDVTAAKLYEFDTASGSDAGSPLMCRIVTAPQHVYPGEVEYNALYIDGIAGSGLNTPGDAVALDPVIVERDSDDGGANWSNEINMPVGRQGATATRTVTHQLGTSGEDGRIFELVWDASANKAITGAAVDAVAVAP